MRAFGVTGIRVAKEDVSDLLYVRGLELSSDEETFWPMMIVIRG